MNNLFRIFLILLVMSVAAAPAGADSTEPPDEEPKIVVDLERTSHVVRQTEDRLNFRYRAGRWDFEGLFASLSPRFREDRDQIGILVSRIFGGGELTAVARRTDKPVGEDIVGSVSYRRTSADSAYGAEITWGQADLLIDDFLLDDGEGQFVGRAFWRRAGGLEVTVFAASSATFDLMRGTDELLERLPRSEIVGVETLADLYLDEDVLEDSAGVSVGFGRQRFEAHVYVKSGEQTIRGVPVGDDFTGFGGDFRFEASSWSLDAELDLRSVDPTDGFGSFDRGRFLLDFRHRPGRLEWGVGGYLQGESEAFIDIPDFYDTAGVGLTVSKKRDSGNRIGLWAMWEDNAPEVQVITRLGVFYHRAERQYGVGVRRDERINDESVGPFFFFKTAFGNVLLDADLGVQDGDAYGTLSLGFKR